MRTDAKQETTQGLQFHSQAILLGENGSSATAFRTCVYDFVQILVWCLASHSTTRWGGYNTSNRCSLPSLDPVNQLSPRRQGRGINSSLLNWKLIYFKFLTPIKGSLYTGYFHHSYKSRMACQQRPSTLWT